MREGKEWGTEIGGGRMAAKRMRKTWEIHSRHI